MMECCGCNAFTTPRKGLCTNHLSQKNKCVPCITHSLSKDDRIPSACKEGLTVWVTVMMIYPTRRSVFIGNPILMPAGSKTLEQLGIPRLLTQPGQVFDHDVPEIHHAAPICRVRGSDRPEQRYELTHFTTQDWGTHYHMDMAEEEGQVVTFGRLNRQGIKMMVIIDYTLGREFHPVHCNPAACYEVEGGARKLRQVSAKSGYGRHQVTIYSNCVKELQELGEIVGFEAEMFH